MLVGAGIFLNGLSRTEVIASADWCASIKFSRSNPGEPDNCEIKFGGNLAAFILVFKDTKQWVVTNWFSMIIHTA